MVPFGILGIVGDQFYLKGLKTGNIEYFKFASILFPYEKELAIGYVEAKLKVQLLDKDIKEALKYDPYSVQLLGMYAQYENYFGNKNDARIALKQLEKISPNSNMLKEIKKVNPKGF